MKKTLSLIVCCLFLCTSTSFAEGENTIPLKNNVDLANTTRSQMDPAALGIYFVSPIKLREKVTVGGKETGQFVQLAEKFVPINLERTFGQVALANPGSALIDVVDNYFNALIDVTSLCSGKGDEEKGLNDPATNEQGEAYKRLHHCARYHPDQFSALTNIMKPYMEWRQSETSNILKLYTAKFESNRLADRLEGRLMLNCIKQVYGTLEEVYDEKGQKKTRVYTTIEGDVEGNAVSPRDVSASLVYCSNPANWNLHTLFPVTAREMCMHDEGKTDTIEHLSTYLDLEEIEEPEDPRKRNQNGSPTVTPPRPQGNGKEYFKKSGESYLFDEDYSERLSEDGKGQNDDQKAYAKGKLYEFSLPYFIESCLINKNTVELDTKQNNDPTDEADEIPAGIKVAYSMIPYFNLRIEKKLFDYDGNELKPDELKDYKEIDPSRSYAVLKIETYPMSVTAEELYDALYMRAFGILSSEWFGAGQSEGWFPSPFAPKNKWIEAASKKDKTEEDTRFLRQFSSIYIPIRIASKIQQTGAKTAPHYWRLIAQKIATIQSLEVLYGSTMLLQEAHRILNGVDTEFTVFLETSVKFMQTVTESYKNSIDLAQSSTLEDILEAVEQYISSYNERAAAAAGVNATFLERIREYTGQHKDP